MLQFSDLLLILTGIFLALSGAFLLFFQHFPASLTGPSALLRPGTEKGKGIDKNSELKALRLMHDKAPHPVWQINSDGETAWQNPVYEQIVADHPGARKIFRNAAGTPGTHRVCLEKTDKTAPDWYEITVASDNDRKLCHAVCISAQVEAEEKRRNMVQTLAKTFAHLSTGLAIFDNSGRLSLFNPALLELTRLSPAFLSTGPQIGSFFDAIRENRHMPEPRDYQDWRQKIAQMVQEAANGSFHETWTLENGRTYSVFGRPHPEGATAFLIEDISAEVTSTRNYRTEMELNQNIMDSLDEAIAVFSATGILIFSNARYRALWGQDPDATFADITLHDCISLWKNRAEPCDAFDTIFRATHKNQNLNNISLRNGHRMTFRSEPVGDNALLVGFRAADVRTLHAIA